MGDLFMLRVAVGICCATLSASAWSVNNFLITGPKAYLTYTASVALGAQSGIEECKFQFAWERWNCPENALQLSTHNRMRSATRETSFIHAISSAGVMYTITKNCSMGDFENCGWGHGWIWGGCSDNVEFGERISKLFVDSLEEGRDARALVNLHNNRAGRLAVRATMKRTCKCHGISGSCSVQTCWLQLADFRTMGDYLKAKYSRALKMEMDKRQLRAGNSAEGHWTPAEAFLPSAEAELIFLEESPDYCTRNSSLGVHGTEGRECRQSSHNASGREQRSCGRLCTECGLQVEERRVEAISSCNCKFQWCCMVSQPWGNEDPAYPEDFYLQSPGEGIVRCLSKPVHVSHVALIPSPTSRDLHHQGPLCQGLVAVVRGQEHETDHQDTLSSLLSPMENSPTLNLQFGFPADDS
ncbi:hypothetical protein MC885_008129 [Smutsia gigantea]|nr:hypothetical protein MC885_008129 [Smutsia gigantea]